MSDAARLLGNDRSGSARSVLDVDLPLYLRGSQNLREHWAARSRRVRNERKTAALLLSAVIRASFGAMPASPRITITRYGSVLIRDDDNLRAACKAVRDGIADAIGIDDGDARLTWIYKQGRCRRGQESVHVSIA